MVSAVASPRAFSLALFVFSWLLLGMSLTGCTASRSVGLQTATHRLERGHYEHIVFRPHAIEFHRRASSSDQGDPAYEFYPIRTTRHYASVVKPQIDRAILTARSRGFTVTVQRGSSTADQQRN